jgi:hypothetical protein
MILDPTYARTNNAVLGYKKSRICSLPIPGMLGFLYDVFENHEPIKQILTADSSWCH